jgi:hypothetical protein
MALPLFTSSRLGSSRKNVWRFPQLSQMSREEGIGALSSTGKRGFWRLAETQKVVPMVKRKERCGSEYERGVP